MNAVRAALYLDFDNVFSGLLKLDPAAAIAFAETPAAWLTRLSTSLTVDGPRRWLVLRCYMNPAGSVPHPDAGVGSPRLYFSKFRPHFTRAGFEVIDCPSLTYGHKNAADIRMVLDVVDALSGGVPYEEFVVASGDSDLTPLLVRLRAADRRTTIVSPFDAADAFTATADRLIDGQRVLELLNDEPIDPSDEGELEPADVAEASLLIEPSSPIDPGAKVAFQELVSTRYHSATAPLNLASLAHEARQVLGATATESRWFGAGTFGRALVDLRLENMQLSQQYLWDAIRHARPEGKSSVEPTAEPRDSQVHLPPPVARLSALLGLPRLPANSWPRIYATLAEGAGSPEFNLSMLTKAARDQLRDSGVAVNRKALTFVAQGASYGGTPLYRDPPPSADEIADAFVTNLLARAMAADIDLTEKEVEVVTTWLGHRRTSPADVSREPSPGA